MKNKTGHDVESMSWEDVCRLLAQGAVNITEGHTTISPNSPIHLSGHGRV